MDTAIARASRSHPPIFEDALGKRYRVSGPGGEKLEVLALHETLTSVSAFEFSLRERVAALASFQHAQFPRVRGVQRLGQDSSTITIVSEYVTGARLSDVLTVAEQQLLSLDINAGLHLIRQLVHAIAALHEQMRGISHGAIAPQRLVVAPNGRVVVVDHVFGAAIEQLHFTHERYWKELAIPLPNPHGTPRVDQRADVLQVGAVALALIVGRPLYTEEFPEKIGALAERAWGLTASGGVEPLPAAVRTWLARALQLDARQSFPSAVEARAELDRVMASADHVAAQSAVRAFLVQYAKHAPSAAAQTDTASHASAPAPPAKPPATAPAVKTSPAAAPPVVAPPAAPAVAARSEVAPPPVVHAPVARPAVVAAPVGAAPAVAKASPAPPVRAQEPPVIELETESEDMTTPWWRQRWIAAIVVLVALAGVGTIAGRSYLTPPAVAEATGTLVVESDPPGAAALVDGDARGLTPLTLMLSPGAHVLEVGDGATRRTIPITITAGGTVSQFLDLPKTVAPTTGQLQVRSEPAGARVMVDGAARGQTPLTIDGLSPGEHMVMLTNDLASVTHAVRVEAGATAALVVPMTTPQGVPVSGWIAVAAPVDVQVFERDRLLGSSRSDRIMVAVGRHELDIVNEALGFRLTRAVNVGPGQVAPVKFEWPNGSMAINAQPWAEVWIDGERVGETPIGNVAVAIGPHEVVFRHPELGEQVLRTTVTVNTPTRLSVDLRKR